MRDFEDFFPHVMPYAPAAPQPVVIHHLREAAITFCTRTKCWREEDAFPVDGQDTVLCVPPHAALVKIERAWFDGCELAPVPYSSVAPNEESGLPEGITTPAFDRVQLIPHGSYSGQLKINMILKPSQEAELLPDVLYDHFARKIAVGALSTMLILPNQPYSNPGLAAIFAQEFQDAMDCLFASNISGQQRAPLRARSRFF